MNAHRFPTIEALESRIAPAGIVAITYDAITGILTLAGDASANDVSIAKTGASTHRILGLGGTDLTVNTVPTPIAGLADIGKITSITFNGGASADTLALQGIINLTSLTLNGDAGLDTFTTTGLGVKGVTNLDLGADGGSASFQGDTIFGGEVIVNYGGGGTVTAPAGGAIVFKGALTLNGGAGADVFTLGTTSAVLGKGVKFNGSGGANELNLGSTVTTVAKSATGKAVLFDGGASADTLTISGARATFLGPIEFNGGLGGNTFAATPSTARVDGELKVTGDAGADDFSWASASVTIKGPVKLELGAAGVGDNTAAFSGASVVLASTLTVIGGGGSDLLNLGGPLSTDSFSVKGAVTVTQGNGSNKVAAAASVLAAGAGFKVTGGVDDDAVDLTSALTGVLGKFEVSLGDGANSFSIGSQLATFGSDLAVTNGDGGGILDFGATKLKVAGAVTVNTGVGDDSVNVIASSISIGKALTINTGDGGDSVNMATDGTVKGDVTIDLGIGAGSQFLDLGGNSSVAGNLKLGAKLTVLAATTGVGNIDFINILNVSVAKAALLTLSDVDSTLKIDNLLALDTVTIGTGAGADTVDIEQDILFGASLFTKKVSINLGDDADALTIGISSAAGSSSFGRFLGGLAVLSGAGADTGNDFLNPTINFFKPGTLNTSDI